jgi:hypothetical protein
MTSMNGNVWKCMEMYGNVWKCMEMCIAMFDYQRIPETSEMPGQSKRAESCCPEMHLLTT